MRFAPHLKPPYYAVIFTSQRSDDMSGYAKTSERMLELASQQPGYLGVESVQDTEGFSITVSYWQDEASIAHWRQNLEHLTAQKQGRTNWYKHFELRVAKVERVGSIIFSE